MAKPTHVLVITGPTTSGKTALALELAEKDRSIEIVNADASLLYRLFDIGTAKPEKEILAKAPHHLIDILEPDQPFNAADYSRLARQAIREIVARGNTPVVVGGTGFYIDALFDGILGVEIPEEEMKAAKERTRHEMETEGFDAMHEKLRTVDPDLYTQILREQNPLRLHRAWQHYYATGSTLGKTRKQTPEQFEYLPEYRVLQLPREGLWRRIVNRVDQMFAKGWLSEAIQLKSQGVIRTMPAMRAIGYRELFDVIDGTLTLEEAREKIIIRTRQYAKRQVTWMKKYEAPR